MKRFFGFFIVFLYLIMPANASETDRTEQTSVDRVNKIGKTILTSNKLSDKIDFKVIKTDEINAFANGNNEIYVYTGLLKFVEDDAELAGVIAHEIGHIINNHVAKQSIVSSITSSAISQADIDSRLKTGMAVVQNLSMKKMSRTDEYEADITGVDLINNAGYNPLAMVSVLYKISGKYVDIIQTHPSGDKRTMYIYDYIAYTYPSKLKLSYKSDSYKQFMNYAAPIIEKRNSSPKKLAAFNKKQEKLKLKRQSKMKKYRNSNQFNPWQNSYNLLRAFSS